MNRTVPTTTPPTESGKRLAVFARGPTAELRISLSEYQGHEFVAARVWEMDRAGGWWPSRTKGVSIRLSEVRGLIDALRSLEGHGQPAPARPSAPHDSDRPAYIPPRNRRPEPRQAPLLPEPCQEFDEFTPREDPRS